MSSLHYVLNHRQGFVVLNRMFEEVLKVFEEFRKDMERKGCLKTLDLRPEEQGMVPKELMDFTLAYIKGQKSDELLNSSI